MATRPQVITAQIIIEAGTESPERTRAYVINSLKSATRNIRDGSVVIALYDDKENLIGVDMSGTPSETLQHQIDDLLEAMEGKPPVHLP